MNTRGHRFGGPWTEQKLGCVSKYLHAYTTIMRKYKFHYNSNNVPLYLLCFAAGNPKAAETAVNIAQDILLKPLGQEVSLIKQPEQLELL